MTNLILGRRGFLGGVAAIIAAPAFVRAASIMPVRALETSGLQIIYRRAGLPDFTAMLGPDPFTDMAHLLLHAKENTPGGKFLVSDAGDRLLRVTVIRETNVLRQSYYSPDHDSPLFFRGRPVERQA